MKPKSSPREPLVIVADDDAAMGELMGELLETLGDVEVVCGGPRLRERLEELADQRPGAEAVLVADVRMPGFGGLNALAFVRARLPNVSVILVTAFGDRELHRRAAEMGAHAVIDKPFAASALLDQVQHVLFGSPLQS